MPRNDPRSREGSETEADMMREFLLLSCTSFGIPEQKGLWEQFLASLKRLFHVDLGTAYLSQRLGSEVDIASSLGTRTRC